MKNQFNRTLGVVLIATILTFVVFMSVLVRVSNLAQAAPPAAPTPLADFLMPAVPARAFNLETSTAITADANTAGVDVLGLGAVDIQYVIDHVPSGEVQTTTLRVQYSNDNSNWAEGAILTTSSVADGTDIARVPVFGRFIRINKNVSSNGIAITTTLVAVGR